MPPPPTPLKVNQPLGPGSACSMSSKTTCSKPAGPPDVNVISSKSTRMSVVAPPSTPASTITISSTAPSKTPLPPVPRSNHADNGALTSVQSSSKSLVVKVVSNPMESSDPSVQPLPSVSSRRVSSSTYRSTVVVLCWYTHMLNHGSAGRTTCDASARFLDVPP